MDSKTKEWKNLRHILIQHDPTYMACLQSVDDEPPASKIIESIIDRGFEKYRSFLTKLIYGQYKRHVSTEDIDIVAEITGKDRVFIFDRLHKNVDEPLVSYFRENFHPIMRRKFKSVFVNNPNPERDSHLLKIIITLKSLNSQRAYDSVDDVMGKYFK